MAAGHRLVGVFTQPDRPAGRGRKPRPPAVKLAALQAGLAVFQPLKIGEPASLQLMRELAPDLIVVVAFGQFLPSSLLHLPRHGCVNLHASLLPKYRGAAPINWAVINGERRTGVTTMLMDEGMDTGKIILKKAVNIDPRETAGSLHDKLAVIGAGLLVQTLEQIAGGSAVYQPQDETFASYAPSIRKEDTVIDWSRPARRIDCFVRGLSPSPSARTFLGNSCWKILAVQPAGEGGEEGSADAEPGQIIACERKKGILVGTGSTPLWLTRLQPPGRTRMSAAEYLAGARQPLTGKLFGRKQEKEE